MTSRNMACDISMQGQRSKLNINTTFYSTEHCEYVGSGKVTKFKCAEPE